MTNGQQELILFSGLSALTVGNKRIKHEFALHVAIGQLKTNLPCVANHPATKLALYYKDSKNSKWIVENITSDSYSPGVYLNVSLSKELLPRYYQCVGTLNSTFSEVLYIDFPKYPDPYFLPRYSDVVYNIPLGQVFLFECYSTTPVRMLLQYDSNPAITLQFKIPENDFSQGAKHIIRNSVIRNLGYVYYANAAVRNNGDTGRNTNISEMGEIVCQGNDSTQPTMHWRYKLLGNENRQVNYSQLYYPRTYYATTTAPDNTTVNYIRANTPAEIQMRIKCLETKAYWNLCNHRPPSIPLKFVEATGIVYFQMPENVAGMFQWIYPKSDREYTALGFGQQNGNKDDLILSTEVQNTTVKSEQVLLAMCTSVDMIYYGVGFWVFLWKNGSYISVPQSSIISDKIDKSGSMSIRRSEIVVDNFEILKLACFAITRSYDLRHRIMSIVPTRTFSADLGESYSNRTKIISAVIITVVSVAIIALFMWITLKKSTSVDREFQAKVKNFFEGYELVVQDENNPCSEAESRPYDKSFEIAKDKLNIDWTSALGSGAFGFVLKGTLACAATSGKKEVGETSKTVAVKTIKENCDLLFINALMSELKMMIYIGKHSNVVNLTGACTRNLLQRQLFIVMEFCRNGSLHQYLINNRSTFTNTLIGDTCLSKMKFEKLHKNFKFSKYEFTTVDLYLWSRQIISGMEYLAKKKIIHGDLATRNILLDEFFIAKISDFGLSRRLYERSEYKKKSEDPLPWRWMAIESIRDMVFSTESDVWSFGITLWEIFSLAQTPYPGIGFTNDFVESLENNLRLKKSQYSSDQLYNEVMLCCWKPLPAERPTFTELGERFDKIISDDQIFLNDVSNPAEYYKELEGTVRYMNAW